MHDTACVGSRESPGDLPGIVNRLSLWERHARSVRSQALAQRFSFKQLRDDIRRAVVCADIVNRQNVWMIQGTRGLRFLLKSPQSICVLGERSRQDFDRHVAIELLVA